jgi:hypothetical protein
MQVAKQAGVRPMGARHAATALTRGGEPIPAAGKQELLDEAALLIRRYSPQEQELVDAMLLK